MPKYVLCKNTKKHNEIVKALNNRNIQFETIACAKNCFKCRTNVMIQEDGKYISASTVEKLLAKLSLD